MPYGLAYNKILDHIFSNPGWPADNTKASIALAIKWRNRPEELKAAIGKLVEHGILTKNGTRYSLVKLEEDDILRHLELREVVETYFVRRLVRRLDSKFARKRIKEPIKELVDAEDRTEQAVKSLDASKFRWACQQFHRALAKAAAYPLAGTFIERLWEFAWLVYGSQNRQEVTSQHMKEIKEEHETILGAIRGGNEEEAVMAVTDHFEKIRQRASLNRPLLGGALEIRPRPPIGFSHHE